MAAMTLMTPERVNNVFPANAPVNFSGQPGIALQLVADYEKRMESASPADQAKFRTMSLMLMTGVPLATADLAKQGGPNAADFEFCQRFGLRIASQTDRLQSKERGEWIGDKDPARVALGTDTKRYHWSTGQLMSQLIHATAIMAFCPGGVTVLGVHFEAAVTPIARLPKVRASVRYRRQAKGRRR